MGFIRKMAFSNNKCWCLWLRQAVSEKPDVTCFTKCMISIYCSCWIKTCCSCYTCWMCVFVGEWKLCILCQIWRAAGLSTDVGISDKVNITGICKAILCSVVVSIATCHAGGKLWGRVGTLKGEPSKLNLEKLSYWSTTPLSVFRQPALFGREL